MTKDWKMSEKKEILTITEKCKIEFNEDGNIKIIGECDGVELNPVEIHLLDRINEDMDNK